MVPVGWTAHKYQHTVHSFHRGRLEHHSCLRSYYRQLYVELRQRNSLMKVTAEGQLPNTNTTTTFTHENFFHARSLAEAELMDPGINFTYSNDTDNFTTEATSAIAVWTWLDYSAGVLLNFDSNGFLLLPGQPGEVIYTLKSDTTNGSWVNQVTVESLWNNTLAY